MKRISVVVVGAGGRGGVYAQYAKAFPDEVEVVAVCEPRAAWRERFATKYDLPPERCFDDWTRLLEHPRLADAALICTVENLHRDIAVALAGLKYHLLLEKPMAPTEAECRDIYDAVNANGVIMAVCHVLRYTAWFRKLQKLIDSGLIGRVRHVTAAEYVGAWHFSHSFVRGNFRNEAVASSFLLAKCCHDIDLLNALSPSRCVKVSSFGRLNHFNRANQPTGAADRCVDCPPHIESQCPYSALKIYLRDGLDNLGGWPIYMTTADNTPEGVAKALRDGPYGRCVYACDNDVADHQVVGLDFEDGTTMGFTASAFAFGGRDYLVQGDRGSLRFTGEEIIHNDSLYGRAGRETRHEITGDDGSVLTGHGGGDYGLMKEFVRAVQKGDGSGLCTGPKVSLESHMIVFAAERARKSGQVETMAAIDG